MQGYFAGTPDPAPSQDSADTAVDFSADGFGGIPSSADGAVLDDVGTDMPADAPIPTSPLALEGDTAVPVSPGYEEEVAQAAGRASAGYTASVGSGPAASTTVPTSPSLQQTALQRVLTGQMGNRTTMWRSAAARSPGGRSSRAAGRSSSPCTTPGSLNALPGTTPYRPPGTASSGTRCTPPRPWSARHHQRRARPLPVRGAQGRGAAQSPRQEAEPWRMTAATASTN